MTPASTLLLSLFPVASSTSFALRKKRLIRYLCSRNMCMQLLPQWQLAMQLPGHPVSRISSDFFNADISSVLIKWLTFPSPAEKALLAFSLTLSMLLVGLLLLSSKNETWNEVSRKSRFGSEGPT